MKLSKTLNPLRRPSDSSKMQQAIEWLENQGYSFSRPTEWQLKIGLFNFYPDRGTILRDGDRHSHPRRGLSALQELLERSRERPTSTFDMALEPARRR
jgi:hypothetical protein